MTMLCPVLLACLQIRESLKNRRHMNHQCRNGCPSSLHRNQREASTSQKLLMLKTSINREKDIKAPFLSSFLEFPVFELVKTDCAAMSHLVAKEGHRKGTRHTVIQENPHQLARSIPRLSSA